MQTVFTVAELRQQISIWKNQNENVLLVPTMGNLHEGHLALIKHAHTFEGKIVCSIFVNALQFEREKDLQAYPRTPDQDLVALKANNVDLVFMPTHEEMYSNDQKNNVDSQQFEHELMNQMCGEFRPGFFQGIVEAVTRLFAFVMPNYAIFGEKDYQQLIIIKELVHHLDLPITIESIPTQREPDGLAFSSRNAYLSAEHRSIAPKLFAELEATKHQILSGNRDFEALQKQATEHLIEAGFRPDYVEIRAGKDLAEIQYDTDFITILAAAWLGDARLIDNVLLHFA